MRRREFIALVGGASAAYGRLFEVSTAEAATPKAGRYFVHLPPDGSPAVYWRGLAGFAGELIQINLNLLAHAVGDNPTTLLPAHGTLVGPKDYAFGRGASKRLNLQPFAFILPGGDPSRPRTLPLGPNLRRFLDHPVGGERLDISLPFYDENIKLGPTGGGWFRNSNDDSAFHAGTDYMTRPNAVFEVCAAAEGRVLAKAGQHVVLAHSTPGGREFRTTYTHMDLSTVTQAVGGTVRKGEFLGRNSPKVSPMHLHFGVAVQGPSFTSNGIDVPALWYFIDPWGVYDFRDNNYLPKDGRIFASKIAGAVHTIQWSQQPLVKTIPKRR